VFIAPWMEISGAVWRCVRAREHWKNVGLQVAPLTMGGRIDVVRTQSLDLLAHNRYRTPGAATRTGGGEHRCLEPNGPEGDGGITPVSASRRPVAAGQNLAAVPQPSGPARGFAASFR
jgi:hypothetical protein